MTHRWPRSLALGVLVGASLPSAVWANQPPGPHVMFAEIALLPVMIAFTLLGGGYAIMRAQGRRRNRWQIPFAIVAILFSWAHEGLAFFLILNFTLLGLARGIMMLWWAIGAARPVPKLASHLKQASTVRLLAAGIFTVIFTIGLAGQAVAFNSWWPDPSSVERRLKEVVAFQQLAAETSVRAGGPRRYIAPREDQPTLQFGGWDTDLVRPGAARRVGWSVEFEALFELGPNGESFTIWIWPRRLGFYPYNYLETLPSFYADESGQLRSVRVHWAKERCPADAPVFYRVSEHDRRRLTDRGVRLPGPH